MLPNPGLFITVLLLSFLTRLEPGGKSNNDPSVVFTNPLLPSGPDPWVTRKGDWYYVTHTTGKDLRLYRTKNMSDLHRAEVKTAWVPPATGLNSKHIWAPEIHWIDGKWYFYYAADDGINENHRMWVLENASEDPFTGTWIDRGKVELPDDKWAIDGTILELDGQLYFLWSGWEGSANVRQNLYIVQMTDPFTAEGPRMLLSTPEHTWEKMGGSPAINEAPQVLKRDGKVFVTYSASGCWTDDYAMGLLETSATSDLMNPGSWIKHPEPIFEKSASARAFGPGHNSFFISRDGTEDWILYHANPEAGQGCGNKRSPRMQKFTWTHDGIPELGNPVRLGSYLERPAGEK